MGYALKIKNVDFSSVALAHVTYVEPIPCTAVMLSPSSLTFDTAEESKQLTATKVPADTTDTLFWSSSNENVATVDSTGLVTIHGIGTAMITATCGNVTATIAITQTSLKAQYELKIVPEKSLYSTGSEGNQCIFITATANESIVAQPYHASNADLRIGNGENNDIELVPVPYGATKVYVKTSDDERVTISYLYIARTTEKVTLSGKEYAKYIERVEFLFTDVGKSVEFGQGIILRPGNGRDISTLSYIYFE